MWDLTVFAFKRDERCSLVTLLTFCCSCTDCKLCNIGSETDHNRFFYWCLMLYSLSLSRIPGQGAGDCPNPFQVAPEASRIGCKGVSWPGVPTGVIMGRTLEHQMLDRLVSAVAVRTDGRVPALDPVKVSCYQRGMTSAYLCHRHALVPGPIPLPTLVTVLAACEDSVDPGMWITEVPILSDALFHSLWLMPAFHSYSACLNGPLAQCTLRPGFRLFYWQKKSGVLQDFPGPP